VAKLSQYRDHYLESKDEAESRQAALDAARADKALADVALADAEGTFARVIEGVGGSILDPARGGVWALTLHSEHQVAFLTAASLDDDFEPRPEPAPVPEPEPAPAPDLDEAMGELLARQMPKSGVFLPRGVTWADVLRAMADLRQGRRPKAPKGIDDASFFDILLKIFQAMPLLAPFIKVLAEIFGPKPDPNPTPTPAKSGR
jgi:hypothetical protein